MTTTIAAFLLSISVVAAAAAWIAEEGVRRFRRSTRWVWLAALMAGPVLLVAAAVMPDRPSGVPTPVIGPVIELSPVMLGAGSGGFGGLNGLVGGLWLLSSAGLALLLLWTHLDIARARRDWERAEVLGRSVYVSSSRGPAVAGFLRPWIVLPRWALALPERDLGMVVLHEEEHVRAKDPVLLGVALSLVVATPWNPLTWWQLRRLRTAMEMDCDRRVLRREPDHGRYGRSLLSVAERASGPALGLAAFTERPLSLERRIVAMTWKNSRWTPLKAGLLILLASVVGAQACGVAIPLVDDPRERGDEIEARGTLGPMVPEPHRGTAPAPEAVAPGTREPEGSPREPAPERSVEPSGVDTSVRLPEPESRRRAPAPPREPKADLGAEPTFTPFTVAPSIVNRQQVIEAMQASYPPLLKDAGIGGTVRVYFFINEDGVAEDVRIDDSSGHPALDDAALAVAAVYRFSPALNRDEPVPVWVSFPITFQVR